MSYIAKLKLTLAVIARKLRPKKRTVDFGAPSPHSQRWDEREKAQSMQQQLGNSSVRGFNKRLLALVVVLFVVSLAADLLLPPVFAIAIGLALFAVVVAFYWLRPRQGRLFQ